jgi:hypothetical protein
MYAGQIIQYKVSLICVMKVFSDEQRFGPYAYGITNTFEN